MAPTIPKITDTGISNGEIITRPSRSQTVTMAMPSSKTHGRLERRSSPRNMLTILGTIKPKNGREPTTTVTTPVAMDTNAVPSSKTWLKFKPILVAIYSPKPAAASLSAKKKTANTTTSTTHRTSYWPLYTEVNEPMNQMPSCGSESVANAKKEDTEPMTAPSMIPTMGTTMDERSVTRRRKRKKIMVPMKEKITATIILTSTDDCGNKIKHISNPSPAHSVVPVVVGSTKRFCVSSCMTKPQMAMAAP